MRITSRTWHRGASAVLLMMLAVGGHVLHAQSPGITDSVALHRAAEAVVTALSSGKSERIGAFVRERFSPTALGRQGGPAQMTNYIMSLYAEHGPLTLHGSEMRTMGPMPMRLHWAHADYSGAWLGLLLDVGPDGIRRFGVQRGPTPGSHKRQLPREHLVQHTR